MATLGGIVRCGESTFSSVSPRQMGHSFIDLSEPNNKTNESGGSEKCFLQILISLAVAYLSALGCFARFSSVASMFPHFLIRKKFL